MHKTVKRRAERTHIRLTLATPRWHVTVPDAFIRTLVHLLLTHYSYLSTASAALGASKPGIFEARAHACARNGT